MNWWIPRACAVVGAAVGGGVLGYVLGDSLYWHWLGLLLGMTSAVAAVVFFDTMRGYRVLGWLRDDQGRPAPVEVGLWGELAYRIERAIRAREATLSQERLRLTQFLAAIEASPNGVMLLDKDEHIQWCNRVSAEHLGIDPGRDIGQRVTNLVRTPMFVDYLQAGDFSHPVVFVSPRDQVTLSVLIRPYGEGMKLLLSQDITERERADMMRRDFVANVSHEIRTPLTVLSGFIETMTNLPLTEVERKRVLGLIAQQTQRMQSLVTDLLTLAQLEGSPRPPTDLWISVAKLMDCLHADATSLSQGKHELRFVLQDAGEVAGAETELLSAMGNLVSNAIRYTAPGGRIEVRWEVLPSGEGRFAVRDTGIGVSKEHLPRLTERFYRVDGSRSRETGGTGLGLSIVKHVVLRHAGELDIESEPGVGSLFSITFPVQRVRRLGGKLEDERSGALVDDHRC